MSKKTADIIFFYTDWCPHSTSAILKWDKFKSKFHGKIIEDYTVTCGDKNCTDHMDPDVISTIENHHIEYYPTVKLIKDDNDVEKGISIIELGIKITEDSLTNFINTFLKEEYSM